jgi:hypothetical protein
MDSKYRKDVMISSTGIAGSMTTTRFFDTLPTLSQTGIMAGRVAGRYAAALQLLSINTIWTSSGSMVATEGPFARQAAGVPDGAAIAATYDKELKDASRSGSSGANQRHIAQFNTIMAHREAFPPGEFYLHTELGDGASITTRIPPAGAATRPPAPSKISITVASIFANLQTAAGGVATASLQAVYAEWS